MCSSRFRPKNILATLCVDAIRNLCNLLARPKVHLLLQTALGIASKAVPNHSSLLQRERNNAISLHSSRLENQRIAKTRLRRGPVQQRERSSNRPLERALPLRDTVRASRIQLNVHWVAQTVRLQEQQGTV